MILPQGTHFSLQRGDFFCNCTCVNFENQNRKALIEVHTGLSVPDLVCLEFDPEPVYHLVSKNGAREDLRYRTSKTLVEADLFHVSKHSISAGGDQTYMG